MREPAERLSRIFGHRFDNAALLECALTHRSAGGAHNERLEFLGDAILGFVVADTLYERFPDADEGQLSRLRALLVKKDSLARLASGIGLGDYLTLGPGELRSGGQSRASILADALEAILAAIYLDAGYAKARQVILALLAARLGELSLTRVQKDPKTRLQEYLQARRHDLPEYAVLEVSGNQHAQEFTVRCRVAALGREETGRGRSRRKAEQQAAAQLLEALGDD